MRNELAESADCFLYRMQFAQIQTTNLMYFPNGWHFCYKRCTLVNEAFQAWLYGPIVDSVYIELRQYQVEETLWATYVRNPNVNEYLPVGPVRNSGSVDMMIWEHILYNERRRIQRV